MGHSSLLTSFLLLLSCARSQFIFQDPPSVVERRGGPASLHCSITGTSNPDLYWYRQTSTAGLQLLSYSFTARSVDENVLSHFTAERPEDLTFTLKTTSLRLNDTAVYFCAWSRTLTPPDTFSQGIIQSPELLVKLAGAPAELKCSVEVGSTLVMYWYRQQHRRELKKHRRALTLISYSVTVNAAQDYNIGHFAGDRPTGQTFKLKTERLAPNDTAVYYCTWSHTPNGRSGRLAKTFDVPS